MAAARVVVETEGGGKGGGGEGGSGEGGGGDGGAVWRPTAEADSLSRRQRAAHQPGGGATRAGGGHGAVASEQSARGGAHLKAAGPHPRPPSRWDRPREQAGTPRHGRRLVVAWARSRGQQRRQGRRDPARTDTVSFLRLARARTGRQHAARTVRGRRSVAKVVVSSSKGHAAGESGERACAHTHAGAGVGPSLSTGDARLTSSVFGSAPAPVCTRVHSSDDETTTVAHLCATHRSWRWTRVAAGTHWPRRIHLTHECHSCSDATWPGVAAGHVGLRNTGRNLASLLQKAST